MSHLPSQDEIVRVSSLQAWTFVHEPIEVIAVQPDENALPQAHDHNVPQAVSGGLPPARRTHAEMMEAFRTLRDQRNSMEEHETVLEQIVNDQAPDSLVANVRTSHPGSALI